MTDKKANPATLNAKQMATFNPADHGLTEAQHEAFLFVQRRQAEGQTITTAAVREAWGGKSRSYVNRILNELIKRGLIERYRTRYYRIVKK